ncbi:MAG: chemotaxis protein CheD [Methylomonas sp.]|jgi:chemotaxis protein CheD
MTHRHYSIDIFLQPGELYFGDRETRIRTLLGSCVSITLWHPLLLIGGMCHYMLPENKRGGAGNDLDGRYADDAMLMFMRELEKTGTNPADYEVKMFGGGDQFPERAAPERLSISDNNIVAGLALLKDYGFTIKCTHLGGAGHRNVIFDICNGHVWMKHCEKN